MERVHVLIEAGARTRLEALAAREDRPMSYIIRQAIREYLERQERLPGNGKGEGN